MRRVYQRGMHTVTVEMGRIVDYGGGGGGAWHEYFQRLDDFQTQKLQLEA